MTTPVAAAPGETGVDRAVGAAVFAAFVGWSASCAFRCDGFLEADEIAHWLYARGAAERPWNLLHVWARPLCTLALWPFATFGFDAARWASTIAAAVAALGAWRAGAALGRRGAACAVPLCYAQPLFFQQSYLVSTEVVFAAVAAWWAWAVASRRPWVSAALAALAPLARPEGFVLVAVAGLGLLLGVPRDRSGTPRRAAAFAAPLGILAWNGLGWLFSGDPLWLPHHWPRSWAAASSPWGRGDWGWLRRVFPDVMPTALSWLCAVGLLRRDARRTWPTWTAAAAVFALHAALWALGAFGSAGYARYFTTVAPLLALLAAGGVETLLPRRAPGRVAALVVAGVAVASLRAGAATQVPPEPSDHAALVAVGRALSAREGAPALYAAHPSAYVGVASAPADHVDEMGDFRAERLARIPVGAFVL
ncbi:MAG TPA: hypothetical protein VEI02_14695, partial [Planctomycetota bacterium]|nr:hypothetical protein [Planctomycetota bacterium]